MQILKTLPNYPETNYVAESKGDYIQIDMATPGYTAEEITIESRENGIAVTGSPKKNIGEGRLIKGFTNFFPLEDPKKFDRANINAEIYNGILTIRVPVNEAFRSVKIFIKQAASAE